MKKMLMILCFSFLFFLLFISYFRPITAINEDLGRHLLLGKIILQNTSVPTTNLLSYTNHNYPFMNSHWGAEVIFYSIYSLAGFNGLQIVVTVIAIASVLLIASFIYKRYALIPLLLASFLYVPLLLERTDVRPEIVSYLLLSIFIVILFHYREHYTKRILLLIPLQIIWVNIHIYFFIGLLLIFLFLLDALITHKGKLTKTVTTISVTFLLACIGSLLNPHGIIGVLFPLTVFHNYALPVIENQNAFLLLRMYKHPAIYVLFLTICILFFSLIYTYRKTKPIDWLLAVTFSLAAILAYRNISLFAYVTFIPFIAVTSALIKKLISFIKKNTREKYFIILKHYFLFIMLLLLLVQITQTIMTKDVGFGVKEYGKNSVDFFVDNNLQGPIYNNFDIGSYLSYRLYPQKIFVDGRPEAYPKNFFETTYIPMQEDLKYFAKRDKQYKFNTLFISHWDQTREKNDFLKQVINNSNYQLVFLDDYAMILVKKNNVNKEVIQKHTVTEDSFQLPKIYTKDSLLRYQYFFEKVGWDNKLKQISYY